MNQSLVSVIIPNHNYASWLAKSIESCLLQENEIKEIIVVDDHSTDKSWDVLVRLQRKYPEILKIYKNPQKGGNYARNFGYEQSMGEYIQWLDADDQLLPGKLQAQILALSANPRYDIAYSDWRMDSYLDGKLVESNVHKKFAMDDYLMELIKDHWCAPNNYLLTRKIAEKLSNGYGWNPDTKVAQDREYFTKAGIMGAKFLYVPGTYSVYNKWGSHTVSSISYKKRIELCYDLNRSFKELIENSAIPSKQKYIDILNSQVMTSVYHHPQLRLKDGISIFKVNYKYIHWKIRMILPLLFARLFIKKLFK